MIYNAEGELFRPIVIHSGDVSGFCQVNYGDILQFVQTVDGKVDRQVVDTVLTTVSRYA